MGILVLEQQNGWTIRARCGGGMLVILAERSAFFSDIPVLAEAFPWGFESILPPGFYLAVRW
jgi:hypothetical protein